MCISCDCGGNAVTVISPLICSDDGVAAPQAHNIVRSIKDSNIIVRLCPSQAYTPQSADSLIELATLGIRTATPAEQVRNGSSWRCSPFLPLGEIGTSTAPARCEGAVVPLAVSPVVRGSSQVTRYAR
eukprot:COSAG06_NODE_2125_length_7539_cov_1.564651_9_plen_128_part_00